MAVDPSTFPTYTTGGLIRQNLSDDTNVQKRWTCSGSATLTWGDADNGGKGVTIHNADTDWRGFYIYHNSCDNVPYKYIWINAGETQFVSLPDMFEGRIVRGVDKYMLNGQPQLLATWFEITIDASGVMWTDVSVIRGCDGAVLLWGLDAAKGWSGFTQYILDGAPTGSYDMKNDGQWVLKYTENSDGSINTVVRDWYISQVGANYIFVDDDHYKPVISSQNGRFGTYWPAGRP
ncbi:hypothetical protein BKA67DRAFT_590118 [Truncatella angustata]|uniref:Uncharacterized protein n=1 Tax=Truncatella angustata TaxID=152316 RepID=A0A9P9A536_9PEZI|nr:uncharacterized protein BKA67DRAFT_590118 [Truncatella angustata]KAH6660905.1 hypothetical protein BKA67DRAFT_590118 [Truncatella angustata]